MLQYMTGKHLTKSYYFLSQRVCVRVQRIGGMVGDVISMSSGKRSSVTHIKASHIKSGYTQITEPQQVREGDYHRCHTVAPLGNICQSPPSSLILEGRAAIFFVDGLMNYPIVFKMSASLFSRAMSNFYFAIIVTEKSSKSSHLRNSDQILQNSNLHLFSLLRMFKCSLRFSTSFTRFTLLILNCSNINQRWCCETVSCRSVSAVTLENLKLSPSWDSSFGSLVFGIDISILTQKADRVRIQSLTSE